MTRQGGNGRLGPLKTETLDEGKGLCQKSQSVTKEQLALKRPSAQPQLLTALGLLPYYKPTTLTEIAPHDPHQFISVSQEGQGHVQLKKKNRTPAPSPCGVDKRAIRQQLSISIEKPASASHQPSSGGKIPVLERLKQAIQTSTEQEKNILIPKVGLQ